MTAFPLPTRFYAVGALGFLAMLAGVADAAVVIDWTDPSVSISIIDAQNATVTGNTTGDVVTPFLITVSTAVTTQQATFTGPLGNFAVPLNLNLPGSSITTPRQAGTLMTVNISVPGLYMVDPAFDLLDIDASDTGPPFANWQDEVAFQAPNAGVTFSPVDPPRYSISGPQILAVLGPNIGNTSTLANINVAISGLSSAIQYTYGPGPADLFGQNQRHGISNITMTDVVIPEPGSLALAGLFLAGLAAITVVRRCRSIAPRA